MAALRRRYCSNPSLYSKLTSRSREEGPSQITFPYFAHCVLPPLFGIFFGTRNIFGDRLNSCQALGLESELGIGRLGVKSATNLCDLRKGVFPFLTEVQERISVFHKYLMNACCDRRPLLVLRIQQRARPTRFLVEHAVYGQNQIKLKGKLQTVVK